MPHVFYHEHPDVLTVETEVLDAYPGRVVLASSPFYPGGGGQLADRGVIRWAAGEARVTGFESSGGKVWHLLGNEAELRGPVEARVDPAFRQLMRELHTDTHLLNAFVFQSFNGALVTGAQMNADGTARMDFDLPNIDNELLRTLEPAVNDAISQDLRIADDYVGFLDAKMQPGLIRSMSVAPLPTADGRIRIVEIAGLDRQACGGTHLPSTGRSRPVRILKIDNKGRHNRRLRIGLVGVALL
jgi:misacylated tRNA(Ala) deacylase